MNSDKSITNVCFVAPKAYPLFNPVCKEIFGGAELDLYLLAAELAKDTDFSVSFITADYGQSEIEIIQNVKIIKSLNFRQNALTGAHKLIKAMKKADADIYIQKSASWGTFLVAMFCRLHKRAFLYRTATAGECNGNWPRGSLERKIFQWSIRQAGKVLVQNETDRRNIKDLLDITAILVRNGHLIQPLTQNNRDMVLWVGRSDRLKRPELFIDLAEQMSHEKFIMICQHATGDNNYDTLNARARQIKNLEFIEGVPFSEIDGFFLRAKIFVNTSDTEGFPNTFIQACKCGTPILSLNVNPDNFLNKYKCGLCADGDWQIFKNMLTDLLGTAAREYGQNARRYVEENHNIKNIIKLYKEIFCSLIRLNADDRR